MGLKEQRTQAKFNSKPSGALMIPGELSVVVDNAAAEAIAQSIGATIQTALETISRALQEQQTMLQAILSKPVDKIELPDNSDILKALKEQNQMLLSAMNRPIQVDSSDVEVNMPPRASRFEIEYEDGRPVALIADYDGTS